MTSATQSKSQVTIIRAYLILLFGVSALAFTPIYARYADAPGVVVATWRLVIAALFMVIPYRRQPTKDRAMTRSIWTMGIIGGLLFAGAQGIFHLGLDYTSAANAMFLDNLAPLYVGLITLLVLREPLPRLFWTGTVCALIGASLIVIMDSGLDNLNPGDLIIAASTVGWAAYMVYSGRAQRGITTISWVFMVLVVGAIVLPVASLLAGYQLTGYNTETTLTMIAAALLAQVGGFFALNYALNFIPAPRVSLVLMVQPIITAIAAFFILGETLSGWQFVGGAFILSGVYIVTILGRETPSAEMSPAPPSA